MALGGQHTETFHTPRTREAVIAHLLDPAAIAAAVEGLQRHEVLAQSANALTMRFVLAAQGAAGIRFQPDYRVSWRIDDDGVAWDAVEPSNLINRGKARITANASGCTVAWSQAIELRIDVPRLAMPLVRPVLDAALGPALRTYVARLAGGLR
jgi:carbon monoxide dehydrogenase subunit G